MHNAASIQSSLGGGDHCLAGLAENLVTCFLETNHHFNRPTNPDLLPNCLDGATENKREEFCEEFNLDTVLEQTVKNTELASKSCIEAAIKPEHIGQIWKPVHSFGILVVQEVVAHLCFAHGNVSPQAKMNITANMMKPMDPNTPIATAFKQIEDGVKFGQHAAMPMTEAQILVASEALIASLEKYHTTCREWKQIARPVRDHTTFCAFIIADAAPQTELQCTATDA